MTQEELLEDIAAEFMGALNSLTKSAINFNQKLKAETSRVLLVLEEMTGKRQKQIP